MSVFTGYRETMLNTLFSINNATVRFLTNRLFKNLTFNINKDESRALTGESGPDKSASLHTIAGDLTWTSNSFTYKQKRPNWALRVPRQAMVAGRALSLLTGWSRYFIKPNLFSIPLPDYTDSNSDRSYQNIGSGILLISTLFFIYGDHKLTMREKNRIYLNHDITNKGF